jgi:hypothetical protein
MSDESGADIENLRTHICLSSNVYCLTGKGVGWENSTSIGMKRSQFLDKFLFGCERFWTLEIGRSHSQRIAKQFFNQNDAAAGFITGRQVATDG